MIKDFPRTLSLLRQEKGISQRQAAADFQVSQALLSHYENGVREPGLSFVVKAADYYGVSCDFLLGRTMSRDGAALHPGTLPDISSEKGNILKGSVIAMLSKKLLVNSLAILMDLLGKSESRALISAVSNYLFISFYKMYRFVYFASGSGKEAAFSVSQAYFSELCDAKMKLCEKTLREYCPLGDKKAKLPDMSVTEIEQNYPALAASLFSLLHDASEKIEEKK